MNGCQNERDLSWAEFFAVYMYVYVVLQGRRWEGTMNEHQARYYYKSYLNANEYKRGYLNLDSGDPYYKAKKDTFNRINWGLDDQLFDGIPCYRIAVERLGIKL